MYYYLYAPIYCIISSISINTMINIKKVLPLLLLSSLFSLSVLLSSPAAGRVFAATSATTDPANCKPVSGLQIPKECKSYSCDLSSTGASNDCLKNNPITQWIVFFINLLGAIIVIGASAMLVFAGVEYITAADSPDRVKKAKQKITNVIIGILAFFFLYAFLQWLIPGGAL